LEFELRYKEKIIEEKNNSWRSFLTEIDNPKDLSNLLKKLGRKEVFDIGLLKKDNGEYCQTSEESLSTLMSKHFPNFEETSMTSARISNWCSDDNCNLRITKDIVRETFQSFQNDKAGGIDKLKPIMLKNLPDKALSLISRMYRLCLANSYTPECWRKMKATFIPKPAKSTYNMANCFRPIILSSYLLKCLEKIIKNNWKETFLKEPFTNQHGFTEGRSCDTALSTMVDKIEQGINKKGNICIAVFLDIEGAFDNVQFHSINRELHNRNANTQTIRWYNFLLHNRKIILNLKGEEKIIKPTQGVPQGDPLSDCIWNIIYQPIIDDIGSDEILPNALADDITLLQTGSDGEKIIENLQNAINKIVQWGEIKKLRFNPNKTSVMVFSHKPGFQMKELLLLPNLYIGNHKLPFVTEAKCLGITLDSSLNWNKHLDNKILDCKRYLMSIRNLVKTNWGLTPERNWWIWESVVRPKLSYGINAWVNALSNKRNVYSLEKLQKLALSITGFAMKCTSNKGLEAIFCTEPLHIFLEGIALKTRICTKSEVVFNWSGNSDYHYRRSTNESTKKKKLGHLKVLDDKIKNIFGNCFVSDRTRKKTNKNKHKFKINLKGKTTYVKDAINIYTDGSKNTKGTGTGMVVYDNHVIIHSESYNLNTDAIVYQAELFGIFCANNWVQKHHDVQRKYAIFVDNISALKVLKSSYSHSRTVHAVWESYEYIQDLNIIYYWVKGHNNVDGNEEADKLAKLGASNDSSDLVKIDVPLTKSAINNSITIYKEGKWQQEWNKCMTNMRCKTFLNRVCINKCFRKKLLKQSNLYIKKVVQWGTGANYLRDNLYRMNLSPTMLCRFCSDSNETSEHLLLHCIRTEFCRFKYANLLQDNSVINRQNGRWFWNDNSITIQKCDFINIVYDELLSDIVFDTG